jgi:hypothetical protein
VSAAPVLLSAYAFTMWGLTANLGLSDSFPWSPGPLSNWMTWLALALLLTLAVLRFREQRETAE